MAISSTPRRSTSPQPKNSTLTEYMQGIDKMLLEVTTAASDSGCPSRPASTASRTSFGKFMDAIDRGVGQLVDADIAGRIGTPVGPPGPAAVGILVPVDRQRQRPELLSLFRLGDSRRGLMAKAML